MTLLRVILLIALGLGIMTLTGCDGGGTNPDDPVAVTGVIGGYICAPDDLANDTLNPLYTEQTGRAAVLTFGYITDPAANVIVCTTDAQSSFRLAVQRGLWHVTVETDHTFPDNFDSVVIDDDTYFDIGIRYDFADPDTFVVAFSYEDPFRSGTAGGSQAAQLIQRVYIDTFNVRTGMHLEPDSATITTMSIPGYWVHYWAIPLVPGERMWELVQHLRLESENPFYPDNVGFSPRGFGLCPDDFEIILWPDSNGYFPPPIDPGWGIYDDPEDSLPYDSIIYGP